jgi:hypothetical protein
VGRCECANEGRCECERWSGPAWLSELNAETLVATPVEGPALAVPVRKEGFSSEQAMREEEHEGDGVFDPGAHESR